MVRSAEKPACLFPNGYLEVIHVRSTTKSLEKAARIRVDMHRGYHFVKKN
jgi:hypothetical protein